MFNNISTQAHALVELTQNHKKKSSTKVIAITSGKGGVGKSTISVNMAYLLAQMGKKVIIVDADIGLANLQILLNIKPKNTLYDYIDRKVVLKDVLLKTNYKNVDLCAGKSGFKYASNKSSYVYSQIIKDIVVLDIYDIVLVDTGAGINEYVQEFLVLADEIIGITTTNPSSITDLYAVMKLIALSKKKLYLIFNETQSFKAGETITKSLRELAIKNSLPKDFMVKYLGNVISDKNISLCSRAKTLFTKEYSYEGSSICLNEIVIKMLKEIE
jgi:flagellar biosynthesis protein FlhG